MIKTFPVKLTIEEHKKIVTAARKQGKSLTQFIMEAIAEKMAKAGD